ncbi:unnamed protein product [Thelazia callipaeda]|uniref:C2H2-type domain-containing protein n=1 Tax=Thelazia callipaeda TaxID=103827 RepID=A0A0N5CQY7_THECL|nr:unnamed protein product [Thelazia callipaeda]
MISNNRLELHQPVILSNCDSVGNRNYIPQENCSENLNQMAQFRFADSYRRTPQISVTGRSELNPMGSNSAVGNVQVSTHKNASSNGVDPICPYCDRFISHYKGNIRRHMNQCVKSARNGGKLRKKDAALKQFTSGISQFGEGCSEAAYSDSYQPHALETSLAEKNAWMDRSVTITEQSQTTKSKSYSIKKDRNTDDSFRCPLCDFSTIYKGNMKRHLSTCHGLQDDDLKDGCIDKLKCKEAMNLRAENATRSRRSKNYLKSTPKSVDINPKNGSTPATSRMPEMITNASSSSAQLIPPTNICKEPSLSTDCSFNGSLTLEVGSLDSSSKTIEVPVDGSIQLVKSNTIDETIEAVIANGNENLLDHITSNGYLMSEPKYSV